ncbi:MAG: sialidase family protein [Armatimonadota bacterium]|nr:sialidase family protein [Armatimonadota bacterium]
MPEPRGPAMPDDLDRELQRSEPDYVVYVPTGDHDTGNEHFLVRDAPDGALMAVWTQSSYEGAGDHRVMFARSEDDGRTWSEPTRIVGPAGPDDEHLMSSWGFPITSASGRIYVIWNQYQGIDDVVHQHTGTMDCCYSDDLGATWSQPQTVPMPRSAYDHPDPAVPSNWIVWQLPIRDLQGRWFTGFSRWVSKAVRTEPHNSSWTSMETVVQFMRFTNVDDDPQPRDLEIAYSPDDEALRVPHYDNPPLSVAQEPSLLRLADDRLFCTMRTMSGYIWYSLSGDDGESWCSPRPLLRRDYGLPIEEPLCCCPIYQLADGRYVLLHHNNDGHFEGCAREETGKNRRPAFIALGEFRADAEQPIWFSASKQLMDNQGVGIGPLNRIDIGVYPSLTTRRGENVLWHPDRKFFLVGKRITDEFLTELAVPE